LLGTQGMYEVLHLNMHPKPPLRALQSRHTTT
jgi:hypothetical protein